MTEPVRIAIAGYGFIAHHHARAAQATRGVELAAVMGRDAEKSADFARGYRIARVHTSEEDLAADQEIDAVVIALPNNLHAPLAIRMLESGKHVLVEKPMASNAGEGEQMRRAAAAGKRCLMVGHMWRFDREARHLRRAIAGGAIGRIVKTKGYGIHVNWGPAGWFVDPELAGGGALIDMGVHAIDTVRYLLGDPDPISVYARIATAYGDYAVDDMGVLVINWSDGAVSIIESGWWNPHMDGPEASTQLFGTAGYARLFPTEITRVESWRPVTERPQLPAREEHCDQHLFDGQMAELVAAINESRDPVPGAGHGLAVLRICDAAYRSAREDRVIKI
jgi:predicted dehydrogenase